MKKILFNRQIKLGRLGSTNDPKESKTRLHAIPSDAGYKVHTQFKNINAAVEKVSKDEWKVFCLTKSLPISLENTRENVYRSFFAPGFSRPRMWAQYGENHSGVCLVFDGERLSKNIESLQDKNHIIIHGSVSYDNYDKSISKHLDLTDVKTLGSLKAIRKYYYDNYEYFFLTKHADWREETEYRWLIHSPGKKEDEFVSIEGALVAVVVGADFPQVDETTLRELCEGLNVPTGKIEWINGFPKFRGI